MIEICREGVRLSQAISRRDWLHLSAVTAALARSRASGSPRSSPKKTAVILFWMAGGPSHLDTYDTKPDAPLEVRGPFKTIHTDVPGLNVCDMLPMHARMAGQFSIVHGISHEFGVHDDAQHLVQTGHPLLNARERGQQFPAEGAVTAYLRGPNAAELPAYACIPEDYARHMGFYQQAAFLGARYAAVNAGGDPALGNYRLPDFSLPDGMTLDRLDARQSLLKQFDDWQREIDRPRVIENAKEGVEQAFNLVSGSRARSAFNLELEPDQTRDRYGRNFYGQSALLARRLVEAGVTFVTINLYEKDVDWWDDHTKIEVNLRKRLPPYDRALSTLIADLHERGSLDHVLVAAYGDFGRAPRIDAGAGRGHWPYAMSALLAGGGIRPGQVLGQTTRDGSRPLDRPFSPGDLLCSIYHVLGIDPDTKLSDRLGRPVPLVDKGSKIDGLFA